MSPDGSVHHRYPEAVHPSHREVRDPHMISMAEILICSRFAAGLMLNTSYNIHVDSGEDPLIRQIVISMQVRPFFAHSYLGKWIELTGSASSAPSSAAHTLSTSFHSFASYLLGSSVLSGSETVNDGPKRTARCISRSTSRSRSRFCACARCLPFWLCSSAYAERQRRHPPLSRLAHDRKGSLWEKQGRSSLSRGRSPRSWCGSRLTAS